MPSSDAHADSKHGAAEKRRTTIRPVSHQHRVPAYGSSRNQPVHGPAHARTSSSDPPDDMVMAVRECNAVPVPRRCGFGLCRHGHTKDRCQCQSGENAIHGFAELGLTVTQGL